MKFGSTNFPWFTVVSCCILSILIKTGVVLAEEMAMTNLEALTYFDSPGNSLPYRLLKPADYDPAKKYPLVVFLHGSGERGTDNNSHILSSKGAYEFINTAQDYAYFMLAPQCPTNQQWSAIDWEVLPYQMKPEPTEPMRLVMELIEE
jgi:predicted peptidase